MVRFSTRQIALIGLFGSITVALGLLPVGGFIPVPTPAGSATTMHIPAILAGISQGPVAGAIVGAIFGLFSFWRALTSANPVARLIFTNPVIALGPRIFIGIAAHYVHVLVRGKRSRLFLAVAVGLMFAHTGYWAFRNVAAVWRYLGAVSLGVAASVLAYFAQARFGEGPALAAIAGSLTNTVGVLSLCVFFGYLPVQAAVAVGIMHGIPEALVAAILTGLVYRAAARYMSVR